MDGYDASWLHESIDAARITLARQPIRAARSGAADIYDECLARVVDQNGNLVCAGEFVPHLDRGDLVPVLDRHILAMVLDQLENDPAATLGCNLTAANFADETTWAKIADQLHARRDLTSRLVLEITEDRPIEASPLFIEAISDLRQLGCRIALDDFGVGYSSPGLLRQIEFDLIKIDKSLLWHTRQTSDGRNSLWYLVGFASSFAPLIVVEGVETDVQEATALRARATHLQGHMYSPPTLADVHFNTPLKKKLLHQYSLELL